jgi:hypothetical protein
MTIRLYTISCGLMLGKIKPRAIWLFNCRSVSSLEFGEFGEFGVDPVSGW